MDLLPTLVGLAGAKRRPRRIDGRDIWPLMTAQPGAKTPHEAFFYYNGWQLDAVRSGPWKLILPMTYYAVDAPGQDGMPGKHVWTNAPLSLYDLHNDVGEESDVALEHPDIIDKLLRLVAAAREDLGDGVMRINPEKKDFFQAGRLYRIPGKNQRTGGNSHAMNGVRLQNCQRALFKYRPVPGLRRQENDDQATGDNRRIGCSGRAGLARRRCRLGNVGTVLSSVFRWRVGRESGDRAAGISP